MKKLNLNNQVSEDDEKLVGLLKTSIGQERSEQFVDSTLKKFMLLQTKPKLVHKPLKSPLYMMLVIVLILFTPLFLAFSSQIELTEPSFKIGNLIENVSYKIDSWYTIGPLLLVLVSMSIVWLELGLFKFKNPFN